MRRLQISLLGPPRVALHGEPISHYRAGTILALLAYVAMHTGAPCRRSALAGLLWPDDDESSALTNLRQALRRLRIAIGDRASTAPLIQVTRTTIALDPEGDWWLDVAEYTRALRAVRLHAHGRVGTCAACAGHLAKAVELYRGPFLAEFSLPSALFEEWMVAEREHLHRQALHACCELAAYHEGCAAYQQAVRHARRALALEPWHEAAQQTLMRALALDGQPGAALAAYDRYCDQLAKELDAEPAEETARLYQAICDGEDLSPAAQGVAPTLPPLRTHNLPAQSTPFLGREWELAALDRLLGSAEVRLVTVVGPGGMGKTRLALEAARQALGHFPAGAWLVDLAPLPTGASLPHAVAAALGVIEQPGRALTEVIVGALQTRQLLLVLDNCEHLGDDVARIVDTLLSRCPELTVLATSREPLHVPGEHLYDVPPMEVPPSQDLTGFGKPVRSIQDYDAVALLCQRASAVRPGFRLDEDSAPLAAEVCRRLDGMPLAIELAAARLRALSLAEVASRLDDRFRLLTGGSPVVLPRQRTLRDTVAWSYDLLSEGERLLFDRLSVFAGSFSLAGVEAVCSGEGIAMEEVLELLARLVDQSLAGRAEGPGGTTRYRLLETLRAYGQERLAQRGETEGVAARHAGYYVSLAEATEPVFHAYEREMIDAHRRLDAEADNLASAVQWALAHRQPETAMRIGGALHLWTMYRPHCRQYAEWMRQALAQEGEVAPLYRAKAWALSGHAWWHYEEGLAAAQAGLAAARAAGDPRWIACGLHWVGLYSQMTGRREEARACFQECGSLARQCGNAMMAFIAALELAEYEPLRRRRSLLEEIMRQAPYAGRSFGLQFLAAAALLQGDLKDAEAYLRESLAGWTELGSVVMQGSVSRWLGQVHGTWGDYPGAQRMLERGRQLAQQAGSRGDIVWVTRLLGDLAWRQGAFDTAAAHYQEALGLARQHGYSEEAARARLGLALIAAERGEHERAEALCAEAQPGLPDWEDEDQALALSTRGRAALLRGAGARAVALYRQALARVRRSDSRPDIVERIESLAWALAADGQAGEAARLLALAEREREEMSLVLPPVDRPHHERAVEVAQDALGEAAFAAAWAEGERLELDRAIEAFALPGQVDGSGEEKP